MIVAITGASGHLGTNLCLKLQEHGIQTRVLIRNSNPTLDKLQIENIRGDILDQNTLNKLIRGADYVFHLAAKISISGDPDGSVYNTNVLGTKNVVEACLHNKIKRLVFFSSIHAFNPLPLRDEVNESREWDERPRCPAYNNTKVEAEKIIRKGVEEGLNAVILNPTGIIGPEDYKPSLMGRGLINFFSQKIIAIVRGGFDWVDVRDIAGAAIKCLDLNTKSDKYILSGHWVSFYELAKKIKQVTGENKVIIELPLPIARFGLPFAYLASKITKETPLFTNESLETLKEYRFVNCNKAKTEIGFQPRPFDVTLHDTYDWFKANNKI